MEVVLAHHVSDLDHHVRRMRAANADLREEIGRVRALIDVAEADRRRRDEEARQLGARLFAVETELGDARRDTQEQVEAIAAAADEEVARIAAAAHAEAERLHQALEVLLQPGAQADVVPLVPRSTSVPDGSGDEHSVAM